jgi:choline monooxygenase
VLSNVCRHRWMKICEGSGHAERLVCPYHAWTYALDGRLRAAPQMGETPGFDVNQVCLPIIRHTIWQGSVYINLHGQAEPLAPQLAPIDEEIEEFGLSDWRVAASVDCGEYPCD